MFIFIKRPFEATADLKASFWRLFCAASEQRRLSATADFWHNVLVVFHRKIREKERGN